MLVINILKGYKKKPDFYYKLVQSVLRTLILNNGNCFTKMTMLKGLNERINCRKIVINCNMKQDMFLLLLFVCFFSRFVIVFFNIKKNIQGLDTNT